MSFFKCSIAPIIFSISSFSAFADDPAMLSGQSDPQFAAAIALWLDHRDLDALNEFSTLANSGNRAAQVFLGQIESQLYLHADVTAGLNALDRQALLAQWDGQTAQNWLEAAAEDVELAQALLDRRRHGSRMEATEALIDFTELREAHTGLVHLQNGDGSEYLTIMPDVIGLSTHPAISAEARWLGYSLYQELLLYGGGGAADGLDHGRLSEAALALEAAGATDNETSENWTSVIISGLPNDEFSHANWQAQGRFILAEYSLSPIATICVDICPGHPDNCAQNLSFVTQDPLYVYHYSPAEWAISTADYQASPRFPYDVAALAEHSEIVASLRQNGHEFHICDVPSFVRD